jgi:hypothetical protein
MHDRVRSEIHIVRDFITEKECHAMDEAAKPLLRRASVADGKGGSTVSLNRKAIQAVLKLAWDMRGIWRPTVSSLAVHLDRSMIVAITSQALILGRVVQLILIYCRENIKLSIGLILFFVFMLSENC